MSATPSNPPILSKERQITIVKGDEECIIPDRRAALLKRLNDIENEAGRLIKLVRELRADVLHLTVE